MKLLLNQLSFYLSPSQQFCAIICLTFKNHSVKKKERKVSFLKQADIKVIIKLFSFLQFTGRKKDYRSKRTNLYPHKLFILKSHVVLYIFIKYFS